MTYGGLSLLCTCESHAVLAPHRELMPGWQRARPPSVDYQKGARHSGLRC